jgi:predicted DCC family thiol-disulfide oxidoreductase YuxK
MARADVIFDGDCGICQWSVRRANDWVRSQVHFIAWQHADLKALGVTAQECQEAVQWIGSQGERYTGARAVAQTLKSGRQPWRALGALIDFPPLRPLSALVYRWVARHRGNQCVNPGLSVDK